MDAKMFQDWRAGRNFTQSQAADYCGVTRLTIIRWESGDSPVPDRVVELIEAAPSPVEPSAPAPRSSAFDPTDPKHQLAPIGPRPDRIPARNWDSFPLDTTTWQLMGEYRVVSAKIPEPIAYLPRLDSRGHPTGPYAWIGPRGVINAAGDAFDYETGRKYTDPTVGAPTTREAPGARQFAKTYKR